MGFLFTLGEVGGFVKYQRTFGILFFSTMEYTVNIILLRHFRVSVNSRIFKSRACTGMINKYGAK